MINLDLVDKSARETTSPAIRERVANSKELLRYTLGQIKLLVYDLRPVMLDDFGLVPTLRWYIQSYSEGGGPSIELEVEAASCACRATSRRLFSASPRRRSPTPSSTPERPRSL